MATGMPDESIASNTPNDVGVAQANVSTLSTSTTATTSTPDAEGSNIIDDVKELKLSWLRRLPFEQVIGIVLKLDEFATEETRVSVWPTDLKSALRSFNIEDTASDINEGEDNVAHDASETQVQVQAQAQPPSTPEFTAAVTAGIPEPSPSTVIPPPGFPAPPMASLPPPPGVPPPPAYPYNPYAPFPPHPFTLGHPFTPPPPPSSSSSSSGGGASTPLFTSTPLIRNPAPPKPPTLHPGDDEATLPSYEVMLHHALTVLNDPEGEVPKNLFAWIAVHYPVQINFRPSASQALQKAFKRGRFEKTKDGRYRINHAWEGQTTSRRTTRRPANTFRHPMLPTMFHPIPPPPGHPYAHPPGLPPGFPPLPGLHPPGQPGPSTAPPAAQPTEETPTQSKEQIDAWEAAQSILQELNRQALNRLGQEEAEATSSASAPAAEPSEQNVDAATPPKAQPSTPAFPMPIIAGTVDLDIRKNATSTSTPNQPHNIQPLTGRAALQSHLVLLATQLAELAGPSRLSSVPSVPVQ